MQVVSRRQLENDMEKYLHDVAKSSDVILVSGASDDEAIVILSLRDYNSMVETGHLLSGSTNRRRLYASIDQLKRAGSGNR